MAAFGSKPNITFRNFTEEKKSSPGLQRKPLYPVMWKGGAFAFACARHTVLCV